MWEQMEKFQSQNRHVKKDLWVETFQIKPVKEGSEKI